MLKIFSPVIRFREYSTAQKIIESIQRKLILPLRLGRFDFSGLQSSKLINVLGDILNEHLNSSYNIYQRLSQPEKNTLRKCIINKYYQLINEHTNNLQKNIKILVSHETEHLSYEETSFAIVVLPEFFTDKEKLSLALSDVLSDINVSLINQDIEYKRQIIEQNSDAIQYQSQL